MSTDEIDDLTTIGIRNASIQTSSGNDIIAGIANNTISQFEMMDENGSLNISGRRNYKLNDKFRSRG